MDDHRFRASCGGRRAAWPDHYCGDDLVQNGYTNATYFSSAKPKYFCHSANPKIADFVIVPEVGQRQAEQVCWKRNELEEERPGIVGLWPPMYLANSHAGKHNANQLTSWMHL